jgi:hypothetical protein
MFVDAGRPVDDTLVTALIREVLAEKIAAMLGERAHLDRLARRQNESRQPVPQTAADSRLPPSPVRIDSLLDCERFVTLFPLDAMLYFIYNNVTCREVCALHDLLLLLLLFLSYLL